MSCLLPILSDSGGWNVTCRKCCVPKGMKSVLRTSWLILLGVLLGTFPGVETMQTTSAQLRDPGERTRSGPAWERQQQRKSRRESGSGAVGLPSWARPSTGDRSGRVGGESREPRLHEAPGGVGTDDFNPPEPVPLGGLEWLLAAGAGYGFWRLREDE